MSTGDWDGSGDWRDREFGHGQERYYGTGRQGPPPPPTGRPPSAGAPPPGHSPGKGGRTGLLVGVGVLAIALAAGGLYLGTRGGSEVEAADTPTSARPTASHDRPRSSSPAGPQRNSGGEADHAAFEVPPPGQFKRGAGGEGPVWRMYSDPRDVAGYGSRTGKNLVMGHAPTHYRPGFCTSTEKSALGLLVWANAGDKSPLEAASDGGDRWLKAIATRDDNGMEKYTKSPSIKNVTLKHGKTPAVRFRGKTPLTSEAEKKCGVSSAEVVVTAFETGHGTAAMVAVRRLGHPDSMSNAQLATILGSLRPT